MNASKHILIVEDERIVARDIQRTLVDLGYQVPTTASSGEQALRLASDRCPDLVLMDIRLKGTQDGIETAAILQAQFAVPIVYLTSYADAPTVDRAKATQPLGYLLKPVKADELRSTVELALYRHEAESRLRAREHWLTTTLNSIGDAVISTDANGDVNYLNPVAESLTGVRLGQAVGQPCQQILTLVDERARTPVDNPMLQALRELKVVHVEGALLRPDGTENVVIDSTAPVIDDRGRVLGAVMVFHDISEQKRMQRQLDMAARLASVATIARGITHEVNNPLAFIVANVAFALDEIRLSRAKASSRARTSDRSAEVETALVEAQLGAARVCRIVADLKAFSSTDSENRGRVDIREVLDWSLEIAASALWPITVVRSFETVPAVTGEAARLGLAFVNMLTNAADAIATETAGQKQVTIETFTTELGEAAIEIRDTGHGMSQAVLERAFEPFFTTKGESPGKGLGLSICHGIVTSMDGRIELESELGRGTLVRVVLPPRLSEAPLAAQAQADPPRGYILVVDDEAMVRSALQRALGDRHFLTCPKTPSEALALIDAGMRFDLILCDLAMPRLSGPVLHGELVRRHPDQARRTAFLTGGAVTPRLVEFMQATSNPCLEKPFEPQRLRAVVDTLLLELGVIDRMESAP